MSAIKTIVVATRSGSKDFSSIDMYFYAEKS
jgi:hypothetical protein